MVELNTKYKIGKRRFGLVNWVGFYTLYNSIAADGLKKVIDLHNKYPTA